jgi:hypothetical protein
VGQAHHVVAGVHHNQDVAVTVLPLRGLDQALDHVGQLAGGHGRGVVLGAQTDRGLNAHAPVPDTSEPSDPSESTTCEVRA